MARIAAVARRFAIGRERRADAAERAAIRRDVGDDWGELSKLRAACTGNRGIKAGVAKNLQSVGNERTVAQQNEGLLRAHARGLAAGEDEACRIAGGGAHFPASSRKRMSD